jgi:hypothetical protein
MSKGSLITVGQVFRVAFSGAPKEGSNLVRYQDLTRGAHDNPADSQKGMFFYQQVKEPGQKFDRLPAFIFLSNPFKRGTEGTPWVDVVEDAGYCLYHGDNRFAGEGPLSSRGNAKFVQVQHFYADPDLRTFAPPVLIFEQTEHAGVRRGYRRFCGYGVPVRHSLAAQKEPNGYFTNLVIELVLLRLEQENEAFNWTWIDRRRDGSMDADTVLSAAPAAWKKWVAEGELAIESCRRIIARASIVKLDEQLTTTQEEERILAETYAYYAKKKHSFGEFSIFAGRHVLGELHPVIVGRALGNHVRSLRPTIFRIAAAAARVSASAAKHSCAVTAAPPAFMVCAIWLRLLPTLFSAAVARPSASAFTGGLRLARGPGAPNPLARRKLARLNPASRAFSSRAARSSGRQRTETGVPRRRLSLPLRVACCGCSALSFAVMGAPHRTG